MDVLNDLRAGRFPADEFFGETTLNVGTIAGGTRPNVIPEAAHADLQIRLVGDAGAVQEILEETIAGRVQVEYLSIAQPVRLLKVAGFETCIVRFTTDVSHLTKWGAPLLLGPGSILDAHTPRERIAKAELTRAVELYIQLVRALLERAEPQCQVAQRIEVE